MRRSSIWLLAVVAFLTIGADECPPPPDNIINVETTEPGIVEDGLCSLAEAIENANTPDPVPHADCDPGDADLRDRIVLGTELTYTLTEPFGEGYGLPEITGGRVLIDGGKSTIQRAESAPEFGILRSSAWSVSLENVTIRNAAGAPGISASDSLSIHHSKVIGCEIGIEIGIENHVSGLLTVINSTVRGNGTGVVNTCNWPTPNTVDVAIDSTTFSNNGPGGAIVFRGCTERSELTVINSTFSSNAAPQGGAISVSDADLSVDYSTIVNNIGHLEGGGIHADGSHVSVYGSIVAQNQGLNCSISADSSVTSTYNLTDDDWCGFDDDTDQWVTDPMLSDLDYWGGPTLTHMPLEGSPAIDAGGPWCGFLGLHRDQRNYGRPADGDGDGQAVCDRGAVEFGAEPLKTFDLRGHLVDWRPPPDSS